MRSIEKIQVLTSQQGCIRNLVSREVELKQRRTKTEIASRDEVVREVDKSKMIATPKK